jgi:hypothetical protein
LHTLLLAAILQTSINSFMKTILLLLATIFCTEAFSQTRNLDSLKWVQIGDTAIQILKAGFYLSMPVPEEYKQYGFPFAITNKSYFIARDEYLSLKNVDSVYKTYDRNFKTNIVNIKFNTEGAEQLTKYTIKWQGFSIGLLIDNKLLSVATLPSPIGGGMMSITGDFSPEEINALKKAIKKSK